MELSDNWFGIEIGIYLAHILYHMKKIIYSIITLLPLTAIAQPTMTKMENYTIGETYVMINANPTNVGPGTPGANQHWMFDTLPFQDSMKAWAIAPSQTSYGAQFPTANVVIKKDNGMFSFFEKTGAENKAIGTVDSMSSGATLMYSYTAAKRPFSYGNTYTESYTSSSAASTGAGTLTMTADGWGMLHLPNGNHTNVLRVKMEVSQKDTASIGPAAIYTELYGTRYSWYSNDYKTPLLTWDSTYVLTTVTGGGSTVDILKEVNYLKREQYATGLDEITPKDEFYTASLVGNRLLVRGEFAHNKKHQLSLFNIGGQKVFGTTFATGRNEWTGEVDAILTPGIYMLSIDDGDGLRQAIKLIKE